LRTRGKIRQNPSSKTFFYVDLQKKPKERKDEENRGGATFQRAGTPRGVARRATMNKNLRLTKATSRSQTHFPGKKKKNRKEGT